MVAAVREVFTFKMTDIANFMIKNQSGLSEPFLPDAAERRAAERLDVSDQLADFNKFMLNQLSNPKEIIREGGTAKSEELKHRILGEVARIR
jgi:hypothetical protein